MALRAASRAFVGVCVASAALAQNPPASAHTIRGIVYDSIGWHPLAGAVVQAVGVGGTASRAFTATTDSTGRYRLTGLPAGRFAVGFQHDALNAFGLESPIRAVELGADSMAVLDLAIPAGPALRARVCGTADKTHTGFLGGYILDARTGAAFPVATVLVQWLELDLRAGKLQSGTHRVLATIGDDGTYRACGIPSDGPIAIHAAAKDHRSVDLELTLPPNGVARQDFRLVGAKETHGAAGIALRVVGDSGTAVNSGVAAIPELDRQVTVDHGTVLLNDIPAGSWMVTLRALGYLPMAVVLDATADKTPITIAMAKPDPVLDTVRTVSNRVIRDSSVVRAARQRMLAGHGTLILSDNLSVVSGSEASNALRSAAGFVMKGPAKAEARAYGNGAACVSQPEGTTLDTDFTGGRNKYLAVYLNGERVPEGLGYINRNVPVKDILAVEAYPDVVSAPFLWRTRDACAVVAFWTKH